MSDNLVERWTAQLNELTRRHHDLPVTVEVIGLDIGDQYEARHVPLKGITLDVKDRPCGAVSILLERFAGQHTERIVHQPVEILVKTDARGDDEVLSIESADGTTTLVKFEGSWLATEGRRPCTR